jgi:predicted transcriptional regulator of viral defense system
MEFGRLLELVGDEPVFETSFLLAGKVNPGIIRQQLSRWTKSGRLYQLRRGLYALAPPYQKVKPQPFLVANRMQRASYVSCQTALAFYGLIPEVVYAVTSVSTGRPQQWRTPLGDFVYRHIQLHLLSGYRILPLEQASGTRPVQQALVASPEKALLDLVYLHPGADSAAYLAELRLQNLETLDLIELQRQAEVFDTPKIGRAVEIINSLVKVDVQENIVI